MPDEKTTVKLDTHPVLLGEMRLLRKELKIVYSTVHAFNSRFESVEKRVSILEEEVFPNGPPEEETVIDDGPLVSAPGHPLEQGVIDQAVQHALAPLMRNQEVLMRELHIDPVASELEGHSVAPKKDDGSRPPQTALGAVKRENRIALYLAAFTAGVVSLHEMGVFDLLKGIFSRH